MVHPRMRTCASERGVVVLRRQDIEIQELKYLVQRMGELTGKPDEGKLHVNPIHPEVNVCLGNDHVLSDPEVYVVSSEHNRDKFDDYLNTKHKQFASRGWHADTSYENIPSDYIAMKMVKTPRTGGDTLFASCYGAYDRLSEPWQRLADSLSSTHHEPDIMPLADKGIKLWLGPRGHPDNVGGSFQARHPLVVTNPVTGWKALWGFSPISMRAKGKIDGVTDYEHELMKAYFLKLITDNHDLQYRHRWEPDDVVIWDNRTVLHAGTYDLSNEERMALRVTSLTGRFYCDPGSLSREECFRRDRMRSTTM
ncbi:taurine catabolism dioxygenase [Penicillium rubens]|uniref:taurine catabolism dioxygenase n=1 Tax=Penicillium rubens TaxID=1108849 RepID=UPI002A5ABCE4|nr:taurine catabolism dioxygenase [Penicillium rubens]KAJ5837851.1 taurine catabolism dioxygenase [Penicillium rubens]KAJ5865894.1 taurine catabolism dioxygenase [Penicillium rubens]